MKGLQLVVRAIDDELPGIRTLTLGRPDSAALPSFTPGSHLVIECGASGSGTANAYSLTGDSVAPSTYTVSVLLCPNGSGGSRWMHELQVGDTVVALPARSAFAPVLSAKRHLYVAAGIGITPMLSHLRSARRWDRDARLLYLHRDGRGAYVDEIKALTDHAQIFTDRTAFLAEVAPELADQPIGTHLYVCGPATFMADITATAATLGWPPSRIHLERFGIDTLDGGRPFEVTLAGGHTFTVPSGVSLLEALEDRGLPIPSLCRQGVCGECRIPVGTGDVLHRDLYLSDAEKESGETMIACVSRAAGDRLELNL